MPLPPAFDLDRALQDVAWLVEEVGPRVTGSPQEAAAAAGVRQRLEAAGWPVQEVDLPGNLVACRGEGRALFLAHIDTVADSPGAIDNAAGVATLLELARTSGAADLCLAFPVAEEVGLVGSQRLADRVVDWHPRGRLPDLVVALDLTGQGQLSMMGLGRAWDGGRLGWLTETLDPVPETLWAYTLYSRLLPHMERSDHAPFAERGAPSLLLLGRGEGGIFPRYHQPADRAVEPAALAATAAALEALATAPPLPPAGGAVSRAALVVGGHRVPGWLTWATLAAGLGAGLRELRRWRELPGHLVRAFAALTMTSLLTVPLVSLGLLPTHEAEATARAVMGVTASGWWWGSWLALGLGAVLFLAVRRAWGALGSAPLAAALMALPLAAVDPVLGLPWALGAVLGLVHPLLSVLPAVVLLRPDALRELAFHGLVPPAWWGALWLLAWPALGRYAGPTWRALRPPEEAP